MDAATKRQFKRFCAAKKLADIGVEEPGWMQASTTKRPAKIVVESFPAPQLKASRLPRLPLMVPVVNGMPVLFRSANYPHSQFVRFSAN